MADTATETQDTAPACKGKPAVEDHPMVELGACDHRVGGATYRYSEFGCPDCGVTARKQTMWACGTKEKAVRPTAENCVALRWKAERAQS